MFIIQSGQVQVKGGVDGTRILCTLFEGSVFGEIALLGIDGLNKRTADVVSVGFSNLVRLNESAQNGNYEHQFPLCQFVLKKKDLENVLDDYPDAKRILNARARKMISENAEQNRKEMTARNNVIFERRRDQNNTSFDL